MRNLALSVAAILVLAVASPAFAQPFADVPTDHWAFDAIAELAAKGIIEGFPDGTFKGDRGVSRYEVAIIVARILARIEAIKIPAPAPPAAAPQVTRTDVQTIQRLVNEFRAELAALGVRTTAVEEELTALKAKTTNVSVKGDVRSRYNLLDPATYPTALGPSVRYRNRLTFTGSATSNVTAVARANFGGGGAGLPGGTGPAGQRAFRFDFDLASPAFFGTVNFDYAYLDLKGMYGLDWRLGQQAYTLSGVGWSGYGLLYDPSNADIFAPVGATSGLKVNGKFSGFNYELGVWRWPAATSSATPAYDVITARAETGMLAGWTLGLSGIMQRRNGATALPVTAVGAGSGAPNATASAANTNDTGYQVDLVGSILPGVTLGGAWAAFNPDPSCGAACINSNAYIGWAVVDLSTMGMSSLSPTLTAWYKNYGSTSAAVMPFQTGASTENGDYGYEAWNFNGFGAAVDMKFSPTLTGTVAYESGNQTITGGSTITEYYATVGYTLAPNTVLSLYYFNFKIGAAQTDLFYRVQLTYSY